MITRVVALLGAFVLCAAWVPALAQTSEVAATVETEPLPSGGDADDPAIWVHPDDPASSTIIGTDKDGGLGVYDLGGRQIQYISGIEPNNVDLRHGIPLGGQPTDLVVASDRSDDTIAVFRVDPRTGRLSEAGRPVETGMDVYGICMYRSPYTGDVYVFVTPEEGGYVGQWRLFDDGSGRVESEEVRRLEIASVTEGCVADDELTFLYVGEEGEAIWKYEAEPDGGSARAAVDTVGDRLDGDIEGLTIYYGPGESGYLIASSQGSGDFIVYRRDGANEHVTGFTIGAGRSIDDVGGTDGIDVIGYPLGPDFPMGVFVAQDGDDDRDGTNFKLVPWEAIARSASPALAIHTGWDPRRAEARRALAHAPLPAGDSVTARTGVDAWTGVTASVAGGPEDGELSGGRILTDEPMLRMGAGREVVVRFSQVEVPQGALVRSAYVEFQPMEDGSGGLVLSIEGLLVTEAPAPTAGIAGTARTAVVTWAPAPWSASDSEGRSQQTPDLAAILREIVAQPGWVSGGSVTVVIRAEGEGARNAASYEVSPDRAPVLRLEYATGG